MSRINNIVSGMDYLIKQVCSRLGMSPDPTDVIYQGFWIIEHNEDLLKRYKALNIGL